MQSAGAPARYRRCLDYGILGDSLASPSPGTARRRRQGSTMSDAARKLFTGYRSTLGRFGRLASRRADRRGTLFRKYVLLIVGLVGLVLLLNSALDFWFSYEENKTALFH